MMAFSGFLRQLAFRAFAPAKHLRDTYKAFRQLLDWDQRSHELMASLEKFYHDEHKADFHAVIRTHDELCRAISHMVERLEDMAPRSYKKLLPILREIDLAVRNSGLRLPEADPSLPLVVRLDEPSCRAESLVGGKAAHLAEISSELGLPVPKGFVITSRAFNSFCESNHLQAEIGKALAGLEIDSVRSLEESSAHLTSLILQGSLPPDMEKALRDEYTRTFGSSRCAMRSSAMGEDSASSFAGQFKTILNVHPDDLSEAYKEVIAGKYSPNALFYRVINGFLDQETPMAVLVLDMIDAAYSGIVYSRSPLLSGPPAVTVYSVWGLGEVLNKGAAVPDVTEVSREPDQPKVTRKERGTQETKLALSPQRALDVAPLEAHEKEQMSLTDDDALRLAKWSLQLESHFGTSQDTEWCKDREGRLYLLQSRPLGTEQKSGPSCPLDSTQVTNPVLLSGGQRAASGVGTGRVFLASSPEDLKDIPPGSVLVTRSPFARWAQGMNRLSAVVTDLGSVAGHFASVAREWRVPTLVGTQVATKTLRPGDIVTVDADKQRVFAGTIQGVSGSPCGRKGLPEHSPFMRRLRSILDLTSPLNLLNPEDPGFAPQGCKTLHDIVRFVHEKAVQEMFSLGGTPTRRARGAKKLKSDIPVTLYVLDLGDSGPAYPSQKEIELSRIKNPGLHALWKGLGHRDIRWSPDILHFDWQEFDRLSAGIVSLDSQLLASFAVISEDYLNINIRFGYHFVVIDALFALESGSNYISLRFKGGGGAPGKKHLRVRFLARVLGKHGFQTSLEGDTIDAKLQGISPYETEQKLEMLGFMLGFTRLMDMKMDTMDSVEVFAAEFLNKFPPN